MSNLVLWGHHLDEYQEMFALTASELKGKFLDYGSGPSAFNKEVQNLAKQCVSCDALFALDKTTLMTKASLVFADRLDQLRLELDKFDLHSCGGLEELIAKRQAGMQIFFDDYLLGKEEGRYLPLYEIALPFDNFSFDLALSSHYLFADIENLDLSFHLAAIKEMARCAKEVRIFPLINRQGQAASLLGPVLLDLQQNNYGIEVKSVDYPLQPKGNAMLRVWAQECPL